MSQPSLLGTKYADWQRDALATFDSWLAQQGFRLSTTLVYRDQWRSYIEWCQYRKLAPLDADANAVATFVAERIAKREQRARYIRLLERVFEHVRAERANVNPASSAAAMKLQAWNDAPGNAASAFLSRSERAQLTKWLNAPFKDGTEWREVRDRALVATFLGGGLKVGEATALMVSCVYISEGWILIEGADPRFSHRARLLPELEASVIRWLDRRARHDLLGRLVFPAAPSGRPLHKSSVLRAVERVLDAAGIKASPGRRLSPQTLRNTYAAMLVDAGGSDGEIAAWLGLDHLISATRMRQAWVRQSDDMNERTPIADTANAAAPLPHSSQAALF